MERGSSLPARASGSAGTDPAALRVDAGSRSPVRVFAPASVSNLGCGFDVFGLALEEPGDEVAVRGVAGSGIVSLTVAGGGGRVPGDPASNAATIAAQSVMHRLGSDAGVAVELRKGIPLASGLGGSAASAVAGAVAADALLGGGLDRTALLECALLGEREGSGANHADNVAPSLAGGFVLVLPGRTPQVVELPTPAGLTLAVAHPAIEVETLRARTILGDTIPLAAGVRQWGHTAGLVAGLFREDWELIAHCLCDAVAEPLRAKLVPGFAKVREAALGAGAAGAGLSGSGPSVFALCRGRTVAERAAAAMAAAFCDEAGLGSDTVVSPVNRVGARVLETG
ncbi:MAG: homoserine kinase [Gemmatimonadota bacterium]|nr:homoserine kinase [Gemmatimonadota bacterium]MDE2870552.1 homoserine kinase [Gemmatimonadota bacterium]